MTQNERNMLIDFIVRFCLSAISFCIAVISGFLISLIPPETTPLWLVLPSVIVLGFIWAVSVIAMIAFWFVKNKELDK